MINCASPSYLSRYGTPRTLADLDQHLLVHYSLAFGADSPAFEYPEGDGYRERPMRSVVSVNAADAYLAACIAGLGIIQAPRTGMHDSLASGRLVEVLPDLTAQPMPVSIVHGHARNVPKRVRAIMIWLERLIDPYVMGPRRAS
jgi:DNA-binding transcriptional LysR family regulator